MTAEQKPEQSFHLDPNPTEQQEMDSTTALYRFVDDLFVNEKILPLLHQAGDNPAINDLVADWKRALVHRLEAASQSMVSNAAEGLANILETGKLTEEELAEWRTMDFWNKPFTVSSLCRDDLKRFLSDEEITQLTDGDMEYIVEKMGDAFHETGIYWDSLEVHARAAFNPPSTDDQQQ